MQPVNIKTIKQQAEGTERLVNDMEIMNIPFNQCQIIQMDTMTIIVQRGTVMDPSRLIQSGDTDLTIIVDKEGNLLSWSVSVDNPGWIAKRNEIIDAA